MYINTIHHQFRGGSLSNFAPVDILLPDVTGRVRRYPSVEHYYQAWKNLDPKIHAQIASSDGPKEAKLLARSQWVRADWEQVKVEVMREALIEKFFTPRFRRILLATRGPIFEIAPWDQFWGCAAVDEWLRPVGGENMLGQLLTDIRDYEINGC